MQPSELAVVGLGNGQLDSLTLNGLTLIKNADVIVYDRPLNEDIRQLWTDQKRSIALDATQDIQRIEGESRVVADLVRGGSRVVRLTVEDPEQKRRLDLELRHLRRLGVKQRFLPSVKALHREAWDLRLPWLSEILPVNFRVIQSVNVKGDRMFWRELAEKGETLVVDLGQGRLQTFIDRLLLAGADPERPVALVAHHPTQSPLCWLTTLEEVDELLPQWKPQGATIVYVGTWPHAMRETECNKSFWGSLEAAAEIWLRAQRA